MLPQGKGFFLWQMRLCEGGNAAAIASLVQIAEIGHLIVKIADGTSNYNDGQDIAQPPGH